MTKRLAIAAAVTFLTSSAPAGAQTWTIPGTVNASGLNGTRFVSDLAITNPGTAPAIAILTLVPANGTGQSLQLLAPGQTLVVRNVLQQLWGASGAAATVVTSTSPLLIRARTYNTAASGTYGVALPVVADDRFLLPSDAARQPLGLAVRRRLDGVPDERRRRVPGPDGRRRDRDGVRREWKRRRNAGVFDGCGGLSAVRRGLVRGRGRRRTRAHRRDTRPGGCVFRRRGQRDRRLVALHVRRPAGGPAGRPRERRRAGERPERHVLQDGRADLQPGRHGRDGHGRLPRESEREHQPGHGDVQRRGRPDPRRRGRPLLAPLAAGRLGGGAAFHVRHARRDSLPDEQRGPGGGEARHVRRAAETCARFSRSCPRPTGAPSSRACGRERISGRTSASQRGPTGQRIR